MKILLKKIRRFFNDDSKPVQFVHNYWKEPDEGNLPSKYVKDQERSDFLVEKVKGIGVSGNILEIGCNVGRNLNYLYKAGFRALSGIEISENAITQMKKYFPELFKNSTIINTSVEEAFKDINDNYDLIFTVAVLEHIHTDSEWIFQKMVDLTKKYIITIEDEKSISWMHFPRNYKNIFENLGMKQIDFFDCAIMIQKGFYYRLFEKLPKQDN